MHYRQIGISRYQAVPISHVLTELFQAICDSIGNILMVRGGLQSLIILWRRTALQVAQQPSYID